MKAMRVAAQPDRSLRILPLPLPLEKRKGVADPEIYHRQARGEVPVTGFVPERSNVLRAVTLSDGRFEGLASQKGSLLTFVISGNVTLRAGSDSCQLESGDVFLTDDVSSSAVTVDVSNQVRLVQIDVASDWPDAGAEHPDTGTIMPREMQAPNLKRMYTGRDDKSYFNDFTEIFAAPLDEWTEARPIQGFRILCWGEGGKIAYHPGVVSQIGLILSGALELQVSGDEETQVFYAGDMCMAEDRTGMGHRNKKHGSSHTIHFVFSDEHLWPYEKSH
jgi:hypothetical protein